LGEITIFRAIKGADISPEECVSQKLLTPELAAAGTVTKGTLGCAASHREVWRKIAASNEGAVIMEDDVITHPGLPAYIAANRAWLEASDIVLFSANTDSVLLTISPQGLRTQELMAPLKPDLAWIEKALNATAISDVRFFRLLKGFGLCCYWMSPRGAASLIESCYPMTQEGTDIPFMKNKWPGSAIDGRLNAFFPVVKAYITRPFLAYSPNSDSSTSV
jgi:GR25 family glycosyltransferase involved in LPS biosynthesis